MLAEAGYSDGFKTTIISAPDATKKDSMVAMQADLAKIGIQVDMEFPGFGKWATYMGPGTWPKNSALFFSFPRMDVSYMGGIQFMLNMIGQSWTRPPELMQVNQAALTAPTQDIKMVRAVTDLIT